MTKQYDKAYFDKWYRSENRVSSGTEVRRKVSLALSIAEYFLARKVRSVLDVGCGEGAWLPHLRAMRPSIEYTGIDPSDYVVRRFGKSRNIRKGSFGHLSELKLRHSFDIVVCSDVLHYVPDDEVAAGIREIARLTDGIAYLEILTKEDHIMGDLHGLLKRPASFYRKIFSAAGLTHVAPYTWIPRAVRLTASELEIAGRA